METKNGGGCGGSGGVGSWVVRSDQKVPGIIRTGCVCCGFFCYTFLLQAVESILFDHKPVKGLFFSRYVE